MVHNSLLFDNVKYFSSLLSKVQFNVIIVSFLKNYFAPSKIKVKEFVIKLLNIEVLSLNVSFLF